MEISRARKLVKLSKDNRIIVVTLWGDNKISSCVEDSVEGKKKNYCETCEGNEELCNEWIQHLASKGYNTTEIELTEVTEGKLDSFISERREEEPANQGKNQNQTLDRNSEFLVE